MQTLIVCCLGIFMAYPSAATRAEWLAGTSLSMQCTDGRVFMPEGVQYWNGQKRMDCILKVAHVNVLENCFNQTACTVGPLQPGVQCDRGNESISVNYECVDSNQISEVCPSRQLSRDSRYIISNNYPRKYSKNQRCTSTLQPLAAYNIHLTFLDLNMESKTPNGCYDYVSLDDVAAGGQLSKYCAELWAERNARLLSTTYGELRISIYTDVQRHYRGFLLKVTDIAKDATTAPTPTTTTTTVVTTTTTTAMRPEAVVTGTDDCATAPCQNGGTCQDDFGVFFCRCPLRFSGVRCERRDTFDDCASYPCVNGGTCEDDFLSYLCHCKEGYSGVTCEIESSRAANTEIPPIIALLLATILSVMAAR